MGRTPDFLHLCIWLSPVSAVPQELDTLGGQRQQRPGSPMLDDRHFPT
jgi:hypothetical protein